MNEAVRPRIAAVATILVVGLTPRCASAPSPAARGVVVVRRTEGYGAAAGPLPSGCRMLASHPSVERTELDLATSDLVGERERAVRAGGNVVVAREEMLVPRRDDDCPAASPITDCPPSEGAWFRVVYQDYACSEDAAGELRRAPR
jgi:hypothetical protein